MKKRKKQTRSDQKANGALIRAAFIALLQESKGVRPTVNQIKEQTGLSTMTIKRHLKSIDFRDMVETSKASWRVLTDDVVLSIYRTAVKGNPQAQKLWFQIVEGWSEKRETKHSGDVKIENKPPVILNISRQ